MSRDPDIVFRFLEATGLSGGENCLYRLYCRLAALWRDTQGPFRQTIVDSTVAWRVTVSDKLLDIPGTAEPIARLILPRLSQRTPATAYIYRYLMYGASVRFKFESPSPACSPLAFSFFLIFALPDNDVSDNVISIIVTPSEIPGSRCPFTRL